MARRLPVYHTKPHTKKKRRDTMRTYTKKNGYGYEKHNVRGRGISCGNLYKRERREVTVVKRSRP